MKIQTVLLIIVIILIIVITVGFTQVSQKMIFEPSDDEAWTPNEDYEDLMIKDVHGDETINIWYFDRTHLGVENNCHVNTIIFYHGSTGNITHRKYMVDISRILDCNLLLVDYRGFGKSKGTPSQPAICGDGISAYDWLINNKSINAEDIVIWGESLGGSVGTYVASKRKCKSLLIMSSFSSLDDIIRDTYPGSWLHDKMSNLISGVLHTLPSKYLISEVDCPVAVMHSVDDTLIPYNNALRMYSKAKEPKLLITIKGDHTSPEMTPQEVRSMISFCGLRLDKWEDEEITDIVSSIKPPPY